MWLLIHYELQCAAHKYLKELGQVRFTTPQQVRDHLKHASEHLYTTEKIKAELDKIGSDPEKYKGLIHTAVLGAFGFISKGPAWQLPGYSHVEDPTVYCWWHGGAKLHIFTRENKLIDFEEIVESPKMRVLSS